MAEKPRGAQRCPCQCHWDLSWLRFGSTTISPCDVDGLFVVERHSWFLFIETKAEDENLTWGQQILLEALSMLPRFTVLVVRGPKSWPTEYVEVKRGDWSETITTDREDFQRRVDQWFERANGTCGRVIGAL